MINIHFLLPLLLPVAAFSGWYLRGKQLKNQKTAASPALPQDYFVGLNYLINEQPDKAVEVFIKMLEITPDTFETHLALGNLFRRRGEVDRAIRIHQNLLARPQADKQQRTQALTELAQDYLRAGVLDRAERLLLELFAMGEYHISHLQQLLRIYEQEKDWQQAITTAKKIEQVSGILQNVAVGNYYCEQAELFYEKQALEKSREYLKQALVSDKQSVRASLLLANLAYHAGDLKTAARYYKQIKFQDPDFISEMILPLSRCYEQLQLEEQLIDYLQLCLQEYPRISVVLILAQYMRKLQNDLAAIEFLAEQIHRYPSLRGLKYLVELYLENSSGDMRSKLAILLQLINNLLASKPIYRCRSCGFTLKKLYWQCPQCRQWSTVKPIHGLEGD